MARATTKQDLIMASNGQFEKLWVLIDGMSDDLQNATFALRSYEKSVIYWK